MSQKVADAIRKVTVKMHKAWENGECSANVSLNDLTEALLAIAEELDPPMAKKTKRRKRIAISPAGRVAMEYLD